MDRSSVSFRALMASVFLAAFFHHAQVCGAAPATFPVSFSSVDIGTDPRSVAITDKDLDGNPDLVVTCWDHQSICLCGDGKGNLSHEHQCRECTPRSSEGR
jgi:hypothetical protein